MSGETPRDRFLLDVDDFVAYYPSQMSLCPLSSHTGFLSRKLMVLAFPIAQSDKWHI